jgi:hypothetical protein
MGERYGAFLVRWWRLPDGTVRVVAEQVRSGERARMSSLPEVLAWMEARVGVEAARGRADDDADQAPGRGEGR